MDENKAAQWFDAFCQALRENRNVFNVEGVEEEIEITNLRHCCARSPFLSFPLMIDDQRARRLVEALSGYTHPIIFDIPLDRMDTQAAQILFSVITNPTSCCISGLILKLISNVENRDAETMASLGDRLNSFLTAAALHGELQSLEIDLRHNLSPTALSLFLYNNSYTIQNLSFVLRDWRLDDVPFPRELNSRLLADSIYSISSLGVLDIDCRDDNFSWFILSMLEGIQDHPSLYRLNIDTNWSHNSKQLSLALQNVLRSSTPLEFLCLRAFTFQVGVIPVEDIKNVIESIYDHRSLEFFSDDTLLTLRSNPELYSYAESQQVVQSYVHLIKTNKIINDLSICCQHKTQITDIFEAISKTNTVLKKLFINFVHEEATIDKEECQKLNIYLPKMKHLENLSVRNAEFHRDLLDGLNVTFNLKGIGVEFGDDADATNTVLFYMMRNIYLADLANQKSKKEVVSAIEKILDRENKFAVSIVFEVLRRCDSWFATANGEMEAQ